MSRQKTKKQQHKTASNTANVAHTNPKQNNKIC